MKKHVLLTFLVLSIVAVLISCKKSDDSSGGGSSTSQYGNVTFWSNENSMLFKFFNSRVAISLMYKFLSVIQVLRN